VEGGVPFPQVLHEEVWEEEQSRPAAAAQHTTERRGERERGGEGKGGRQQALQQRPEALEAAVVTKWHQ
jgi:hypothetical protein